MTTPQTKLLDAPQVRLARETGERLATLIARAEGKAEMEVTLPLPAVRLLIDVLQEMAEGKGFTVPPLQHEFSTQQAADFLRVSRPYLIEELLEKGKLPFRKVGNRRRVPLEDLVRFQEAEEKEMARREAVMLELMEETERLGLYK